MREMNDQQRVSSSASALRKWVSCQTMRKGKSKSEGSLYYFNTRRVAVNLKEKTKQQQKVGRLLVQQQQQLWRRPLWLPLRFWVSAKSQLCSLYYFSSFSLLVMINIISSFIYRHYKRSAAGASSGWFEAKEKVVLVVVVVTAATTKACASVASFKYNLNNDVGTLMAVRAAWVLASLGWAAAKNFQVLRAGARIQRQQQFTLTRAYFLHFLFCFFSNK